MSEWQKHDGGPNPAPGSAVDLTWGFRTIERQPSDGVNWSIKWVWRPSDSSVQGAERSDGGNLPPDAPDLSKALQAAEQERDEARPATVKPSFGDIIENGWASENNPTRVGFFVREGRRTGKMNAGRYFEVTDGKGKFWELPVHREHKISVRSRAEAAESKVSDLERERDYYKGECENAQRYWRVETNLAEQAEARAEAAEHRIARMVVEDTRNADLVAAEARALSAERQLGEVRGVLERISEATPGNTNSDTAQKAFSWVHAVANTALVSLCGVGGEEEASVAQIAAAGASRCAATEPSCQSDESAS